MKLVAMWGILALLAAGCGGAAAPDPAAGGGEARLPGTAENGDAPGEVEPDAAEDALAGFSPAGRWENSSCGERKFLRRINFSDDGTFAAVDEVAPCPPKVVCVWSGIVHWRGTWEREGKLLRLTLEPIDGKKQPEAPPDTFVVLGADPPSIGEQAGDLTCPYQLAE